MNHHARERQDTEGETQRTGDQLVAVNGVVTIEVTTVATVAESSVIEVMCTGMQMIVVSVVVNHMMRCRHWVQVRVGVRTSHFVRTAHCLFVVSRSRRAVSHRGCLYACVGTCALRTCALTTGVGADSRIWTTVLYSVGTRTSGRSVRVRSVSVHSGLTSASG